MKEKKKEELLLNALFVTIYGIIGFVLFMYVIGVDLI